MATRTSVSTSPVSSPSTTATPSVATSAPTAAPPPALLPAGVFHPMTKGGKTIINAAKLLDAYITANPGGIKEQPMLDWFGASEERIALFALGLPNQSYVPVYVAREITIRNFRADYACLYVDPKKELPPRLLLIEAQGALHNSIFVTKGRTTPQWSKDFLSGFSQVVDWHCFQGEIETWPPLTKLVAGHKTVRVDFAVIAGLNVDVADSLSQERLAHWTQHVGFGNNMHISTFNALPIHTESLLIRMAFVASQP